MSLPGIVPPKLQRAWEKRDETQRAALESLVLGKHNGEWDRAAEWLAIVLSKGGDPVSASTVRSYRRSLNYLKEIS